MISLSDAQLAIVMNAARGLSPEKRTTFLQRVAGALQRHGRRYTDSDVAAVAQQALHGLIQQPAA